MFSYEIIPYSILYFDIAKNKPPDIIPGFHPLPIATPKKGVGVYEKPNFRLPL